MCGRDGEGGWGNREIGELHFGHDSGELMRYGAAADGRSIPEGATIVIGWRDYLQLCIFAKIHLDSVASWELPMFSLHNNARKLHSRKPSFFPKIYQTT